MKMRTIKMLGLAAVMALAATAFLGAGSASATVLCGAAPSGGGCPEEGAYPEGTTLEASAEDATFVGAGYGGSTLYCESSSMTLTTTSSGGAGASVTSAVEALSFEGCRNKSGNPCTVTVQNLPYSGTFKYTTGSNGNGPLTIANGGTGEPGFSETCVGIEQCRYGFGNSKELSFRGGNPGSIVAQQLGLKFIGWGCSS